MSFDLIPELATELAPTDLPASDETTEATAAPGAEFAALGLSTELVKAITHAGYTAPTDVQARAVPAAMSGRDLLVSSQTGSGKTAAFVWPALERILAARQDPAKRRDKGRTYGPRVLVLAPTRELAQQVSRACSVYGHGVSGLRVAHVVGGVPYQAQLKALRGPLDLLIATPGRLMDLMNSGAAILANVELLVLDEADRMLDMGFIDDIKLIAESLPAERQTMMFSATFDGSVGHLANQLTREAQRISVDKHTDTHASIEQRLHWADSIHHKHALLEQLLTDKDMDQCVVFTSTQRDADEVAYKLQQIGHAVAALHGGMPQGRRNRVLQDLRSRHLRILVATDVAARGIDVPTISHVINHGLPMKAEDYVHRIGRTGRAGRSGLAITLAERRDVGMIRRIERFTTQPIAVAVVAGLEPKFTAPSMNGPGFGGGKPGFGQRRPGGFGGPRPHGGGGFGGGFQGDRRPGGFRDDARPQGGGFRGEGAPQGNFREGGFRGGDRPQAGGFRDGGAPQGGFRDGGFREGGFRNDSRSHAPRGEGFGGGDRPARAGFGGDRPAGDRPAGKPFGAPRRKPD
ncbi:DEAD/DEAH box helicase [Pseudaquabacterium pictum]|uniref:ATP-dependent RNA helicase RhlE n=1 Tax=Pseudaquabacterium pictum TaxID=2315236 RepID=A0A480AXW4_9BURK|nr:DEAD/DEAH box helicase [Rubrivivax pictus]GCL64967.1 ATP-dependent RNA helicase RhlE [Rubrivivax pictus]